MSWGRAFEHYVWIAFPLMIFGKTPRRVIALPADEAGQLNVADLPVDE